MAILDFNLSDAVRQALDRHEARRLETNQHFDSALENLGEAAKNAYGHYSRRKQMDAFGGDDNDGELRAAKDIYIKTGDISQLNAWKQNKAEQEHTAALNRQTALAEEKAKQEKLNSDIADATADYENAAAKIRDASKGGATPSEVDKTAYNLAVRKLKSLGKDVPSYDEYIGASSEQTNSDLQNKLISFENDWIDLKTDGVEINPEPLKERLKELRKAGMSAKQYEDYMTEIKAYNKNLAKALQSEADADESRKRGEIAYQQQQADRAKAKKKEREEEEKKSAAKKKAEDDANSFAEQIKSMDDQSKKNFLASFKKKNPDAYEVLKSRGLAE